MTREGFSIGYEGRVERPLLTLRIDCAAVCSPSQPVIEIITPDGVTLDAAAFRFDRERYQHLVTVPVIDGHYQVRARS